MNCVSHITHGLWVPDDTRQLDYNELDSWIELAQLLEHGGFDAHLPRRRRRRLRRLPRRPGRPRSPRACRSRSTTRSLLIPAMARAPSTSASPSPARCSGAPVHLRPPALDARPPDQGPGRAGTSSPPTCRTRRATSASAACPPTTSATSAPTSTSTCSTSCGRARWEDDAVVADRERGVYADPSKVHDIDHVGRASTASPARTSSEPSPQRTPVLFQAGSSTAGREFAARHAEASSSSRSHARPARRADRRRARPRGAPSAAQPEDIMFFQGLSSVVGGTEEEARRKEADCGEQRQHRRLRSPTSSGGIGVDLAAIDPDQPIGEHRQPTACRASSRA